MRKFIKQILALLTGSFIIIAFQSCSGPSEGEVSPGGQSTQPGRRLFLNVENGNYQSGFHGEELNPLCVKAADRKGEPVPFLEIEFKLLAGTGLSSADDVAIGDPEATTDESGVAYASVTLGEKSGMAIIQVRDKAHEAVPVLIRLFSYSAVSDQSRPLCILEINDLHMRILPRDTGDISLGGIARIAHIFKEIRRNNDLKGIPTLIVNAGDDFENTMFHNIEGGISTLYKIYDSIGVDILQIGNHDYHFGLPFLHEQVEAARGDFSIGLKGHEMIFIWGSVDPRTLKPAFSGYIPNFETDFGDSDNGALFNQTVLLDLGGIRIGLLGAVTDAAIYTQISGDPPFYRLIGAPTEISEGMTFFNPDPRESDYIADGIDSLDSEGADLILVTSHAGLGFGDRVNLPPGKDEFIARYGRGPVSGRVVDLLLSAHSHVQLNHPIPVQNPNDGNTQLVQAKEAGEFIGSLCVEVDVSSKSMNLTDYHLIQVDETVPEDEYVAAQVEELRAKVISDYGDVFDNVVGNISINLSSLGRAQSGLGQINADAYLWGLERGGFACDSALAVPSMYRADLSRFTVTEDEVYDIVPLHKLDVEGVNDESLIIIEMRPGLHNCSVLGMEESMNEKVTVVEYTLETIFSMELLDQVYPGASAEFKLEVLSFAGLSYQVDYSGAPFNRIKTDSIRIGGEPVSTEKSYRLAMTHSIGANIAYILNFIIQAKDAQTGQTVSPINLHGGDDKPYIDTEVPAWEILRDYLRWKMSQTDYDGIPDNAAITGDRFRSVQPDLTVNPTDIVFSNDLPKRGESVDISITVRNLGDVAVDNAMVNVYYESTPWDLTDNNDGRLSLEGFDEGFFGSLIEIGSRSVSVGPYPETEKLSVAWKIPEDLTPYEYPIVIKLTDISISAENPLTGAPYEETIIGNNHGPDQSRRIDVR